LTSATSTTKVEVMSNLPTFSTTVGISPFFEQIRIVTKPSGYFRYIVWIGESCWGEYRTRNDAVVAAARLI